MIDQAIILKSCRTAENQASSFLPSSALAPIQASAAGWGDNTLNWSNHPPPPNHILDLYINGIKRKVVCIYELASKMFEISLTHKNSPVESKRENMDRIKMVKKCCWITVSKRELCYSKKGMLDGRKESRFF